MTVNTSLSLEEQCEQIWQHTLETKRQERLRVRTPQLIRLWDGEFHLQHVVRVFYKAEFEFIDNDTGPGMLELPFRLPAAKWLKDMKGRMDRGEKRNVNITVDKNGARWGGKLVDVSVEETEDGDQILIATFASAFEELKYYTVRSNPILPAAFQFPKVWMLPGPARWAILTTLWFQLLRQNAMLWNIPNDPLDGNQWFDWDMSNWPIVVKPLSFGQDMAAGTIWGMPISRWQNFYPVVKPILEDGELSFTLRHWLEGDPLPWPGANLRHGTLVVGIEDFSGIRIGTAHGGTVFDGLVRTIAEFTEDLLDSTMEAITDAPTPSGYLIPGNKFTSPTLPYAIYRPGITPGIKSAKFIDTLATAGHVGTGGHSMPGVNELISAGIQATGDIVGNLLQIGSIGGSIDTLLKSFYEDCVAGDTMIDGPDGAERIDVLAARGGPFRVWSITEDGQKVAATAVFAFKKGHADLYEYTLENGSTIKATRQHRWLTTNGWEETSKAVVGVTKVGVDSGEAFSAIASIKHLGKQDFYDLHVPGLENYLANGIWNHNTVLAWMWVKNLLRTSQSGWSQYFEIQQDSGGKAYTLSSLMVLRAGLWSTRTWFSHEIEILDQAPYLIGDQGKGHLFVGSRVGATLPGDPMGEIKIDRIKKLVLTSERDKFDAWTITIGDDKKNLDPAVRAFERIQQIFGALHDVGVF